MSKERPHIGVTGPDEGGTAAWWFTKWAVFLHGGRAIRIRPGNDEPMTELHGLIIGGGADINPNYYGGKPDGQSPPAKNKSMRNMLHLIVNILFFPVIFIVRRIFSASAASPNKLRDELEFALLDEALEKDWPVLGICRGAQLINVHLGGTLHSDIENFYTEVPYMHTIWPEKKVRIKPGTNLSDILTFDQLWVNAMHHQAVDKQGKGIVIAAQETNGIIQAIEHKKRSFVIGVQWHPEYMPQIPAQRHLFKALVTRAKDVTARSS